MNVQKIGDNFNNEDLSTKLMQILGRIYGNDCPSSPKELIITSWHSNEFANGCFPYIPIGRTDEDYETLAKPVEVETASKSRRPYLFFAGDHTCREYPGRLHGAFLSGLREAARIADAFLGYVNAAEKQSEYEEIGQSFLKMFKQPAEESYLSD